MAEDTGSLSESAASHEEEKSEISTPVKVVEPLAEEMASLSQVEKENRPIAQAEEPPTKKKKDTQPPAKETREISPTAQTEEASAKEKRESAPTAEPLAEITLITLELVESDILPSAAKKTPAEQTDTSPSSDKDTPPKPVMSPSSDKDPPADPDTSPSSDRDAPADPDTSPSSDGDAPADPDTSPSSDGDAPADPDTSPSSDRDAPADPDTSPSSDRDAPADPDTSPSSDRDAPADPDTSPSRDRDAPADPDTSPSSDRDAPADPDTSPSSDRDAPADPDTSPSSDRDAPADPDTSPSSDRDAPADPDTSPSSDRDAPADPDTSPSSDRDAPADPDTSPSSDRDAPADPDTSPSSDRDAPADPDTSPSSDRDAPADPDTSPSRDRDAPADPDTSPSNDRDAPADPDTSPSRDRPRDAPADPDTSPSRDRPRDAPADPDTSPSRDRPRDAPADPDTSPSRDKDAPADPDTSPSSDRDAPAEPPLAAKKTPNMFPSGAKEPPAEPDTSSVAKETTDTPPPASNETSAESDISPTVANEACTPAESDTLPSGAKVTSAEPDTSISAHIEELPSAKRVCEDLSPTRHTKETLVQDTSPPADEISPPVEEISTAGDLSTLEPGDFLERLKCCYSTLIPNTCPAQYKLNLSYCDENDKLVRCFVDYGNNESLAAAKDKKVLIVVGAKAVGKTTLINGLANYVYGIQWDHDFRFQLIEEEGKSDGYAPTDRIMAYTFPWVDGMKIDYSLTVIDTPGIGNVAKDKELFSNLKNTLGTDELDKIHGVLFVVQASFPKSSELEYISETVLSLFGNNLKNENIFLMTTFSDGRKPIILKHLRNFPYGHYFKFNNSALYGEKVVKHESGSDSDESDEEEEEASLTRLSWKMGAKSFEKFFQKFKGTIAYSWDQTREVIAAREKLHDSVQKLPEKITRGLKLIGTLREQENKSRAFDSEICTSKDYVIKVKVKRNRKVDISGQGKLITNCLDCTMTCHLDCDLATEDKYKCSVMVPVDGDIEEKHCSVCPQHCGWHRHVNNPYIFEEYEEEVETISEELCMKHKEAIKKCTEAEQDIFCTRRELETLSKEVFSLIEEVKGALQLLQHISLKPVNASEVDYINLLIEQERSSGRKGLVQRIKVLESFRKQAQLLAKLPCLEAAKSDSQSIFEQLR